MSNPSDWKSSDAFEEEVEGAFEDGQEQERDQEYDDKEDCEYEDEEPGEDEDEDAATGGCLRTMILATAFWMVVALAALGFCVAFGGRW